MQYIVPAQRIRGIVAAGLVVACGITSLSASAQETAAADVVIVKMVDKATGQWRFEPDRIEVEIGRTIRFVQEDVVPHNVEFKKEPKGSRLDKIRFGPFLMSRGETYDIVVDQRFVPGTYEIVCTPHAPLGMKATIKVTADQTMSTN